jgi:hypothetical protein
MSDDPWLWGDGADLLWGDGIAMGDDGGGSLLSTGTTWNPADKAAGITLSGDDLIATNNNGARSNVRSTTSHSSGKRYYEVTAGVFAPGGTFGAICTALAGASLTLAAGAGADDSGYFSGGLVVVGNLTVATLDSYTTGDVLGCAIDLDAGKGWYSKNGVFASGDPAAGTGEHFTFTANAELFALISTRRLNDAGTSNFGATAFNAAAPSGFLGWDEEEAVADVPAPQVLTYGAGRLSRKHVQTKYEIIEAIDRRIAAKEEAEREKVRKQEEAKRQLAELEEKKRQTKTIAERRRKLEARIAAYQSEITDLRETMNALLEEIERARAQVELQQTIADRRRRMLLLVAAAA